MSNEAALTILDDELRRIGARLALIQDTPLLPVGAAQYLEATRGSIATARMHLTIAQRIGVNPVIDQVPA